MWTTYADESNKSEKPDPGNSRYIQNSAATRQPVVKKTDPFQVIQRIRNNPWSMTHEDAMLLQSTMGYQATVKLLADIRSRAGAQKAQKEQNGQVGSSQKEGAADSAVPESTSENTTSENTTSKDIKQEDTTSENITPEAAETTGVKPEDTPPAVTQPAGSEPAATTQALGGKLLRKGKELVLTGADKLRVMLTPKVQFKLGNETHELWVEKGEKGNVVMMATVPQAIKVKIEEFAKQLTNITDTGLQKTIQAKIEQARKLIADLEARDPRLPEDEQYRAEFNYLVALTSEIDKDFSEARGTKNQIPGDAEYTGTLPNKSWSITEVGDGCHMIERVNVRNRSALAHFDGEKTPRFYPDTAFKDEAAANHSRGLAHQRLHAATREAGIRLQGGNPDLSDMQLLEKYDRAYSSQILHGIKGSIRTPDSSSVIGMKATPQEAYRRLLNWGGYKI